jgi:hypothetical protein
MIEIQLPLENTREVKLTGIVHDQTIGATGGGGGFSLLHKWIITVHTRLVGTAAFIMKC